jgi:hypothetical protein
MDFRKIFQCGLIATCLFGNSVAMDPEYGNKSDVRKINFRAPTIDEIHQNAKEIKKTHHYTNTNYPTSLTITTGKGIDFKTLVDPWDTCKNPILRAGKLTEFSQTCCIEEKGFLKKIIFRYSSNSGTGMALEIDLTKQGIKFDDFYPTNVFPVYTSYIADGTEYKIFHEPNIIFTIPQ